MQVQMISVHNQLVLLVHASVVERLNYNRLN
jgi:hypothetical protein